MSSLGDFPTVTPPGADAKIRDIYKDITFEALEQLRQWLTVNPIPVPISQVQGFSRFTAQPASIATGETTTSTTYADLATVGPTLSGLPAGTYLVLVGALLYNNTAGVASSASVSLNGGAASDADAAILVTSGSNVPAVTAVGFSVKTLTLANNTLRVKYRVNGASTGTFYYRNLVALRIGNT